jgi:hypothetical protein
MRDKNVFRQAEKIFVRIGYAELKVQWLTPFLIVSVADTVSVAKAVSSLGFKGLKAHRLKV